MDERKMAGNKVLPKAWLNGFDWTFAQRFNIRTSIELFVLKIPAFGNTRTVIGNYKNRVLSTVIKTNKYGK